MKNWVVVEYRDGKFYAVVSGLGTNAGTLDAGHTRRTAQRWARKLNGHKIPGVKFKVEGPCK
jgi:hypothetical protein